MRPRRLQALVWTATINLYISKSKRCPAGRLWALAQKAASTNRGRSNIWAAMYLCLRRPPALWVCGLVGHFPIGTAAARFSALFSQICAIVKLAKVSEAAKLTLWLCHLLVGTKASALPSSRLVRLATELRRMRAASDSELRLLGGPWRPGGSEHCAPCFYLPLSSSTPGRTLPLAAGAGPGPRGGQSLSGSLNRRWPGRGSLGRRAQHTLHAAAWLGAARGDSDPPTGPSLPLPGCQ